MVTKRRCQARLPNGRPCRMPPLVDSEACWAHDPANADAAAEARRLVGLRRRREGALRGAYDFEGLTSVDEIRRLLEIATLDTLGLENSIGRARALIAAAQAAAKLLETGVSSRSALPPWRRPCCGAQHLTSLSSTRAAGESQHNECDRTAT